MTLEKNCEYNVLSHEPGSDAAASYSIARRIEVNVITGYVPHYTPQQKLLSQNLVYRTATVLTFI